MEVKRHYTSGGILLNSKKEIYLIYNKDNKTYQLPKGHIEKGESSRIAALREVKEETGYRNIKIISSKTFKIFYQFKDKWNNYRKSEKNTIYYIMSLIDDQRIRTKQQDEEKLDGDWFTIDDAIKKVSFENIREVLSEFKKTEGL